MIEASAAMPAAGIRLLHPTVAVSGPLPACASYDRPFAGIMCFFRNAATAAAAQIGGLPTSPIRRCSR